METKSKCCNATYKLSDDMIIKGIPVCDECHKICVIIEGVVKLTEPQILKARANLQ